MNIEPLKNILQIYKNKEFIFENFLTNETLKKIINNVYDPNKCDIFVNDNITLIKKNTGKFINPGKS